jgi:hypothetical protein
MNASSRTKRFHHASTVTPPNIRAVKGDKRAPPDSDMRGSLKRLAARDKWIKFPPPVL